MLQYKDIFSTLKPSGWVIANLPFEPQNNGFLKDFRIAYLDADSISKKYQLAARGNTVVNTIILGAFAKDGEISRVSTYLDEGAGVVTSRADVHYVATEFGIADLHGKTLRERAKALINIAHPIHSDESEREFREELEEGGKKRRLL